jgi:CRISPR/Cas system-associated exonuclease Cas4 (RecB family)
VGLGTGRTTYVGSLWTWAPRECSTDRTLYAVYVLAVRSTVGLDTGRKAYVGSLWTWALRECSTSRTLYTVYVLAERFTPRRYVMWILAIFEVLAHTTLLQQRVPIASDGDVMSSPRPIRQRQTAECCASVPNIRQKPARSYSDWSADRVVTPANSRKGKAPREKSSLFLKQAPATFFHL